MRRSGELEYATEIGFGVTRIGAQPAAWSVSQADIVYYLPTTEHSRKGFIIVGGDALDTQYLLHARHRILAQLLPSLQDSKTTLTNHGK